MGLMEKRCSSHRHVSEVVLHVVACPLYDCNMVGTAVALHRLAWLSSHPRIQAKAVSCSPPTLLILYVYANSLRGRDEQVSCRLAVSRSLGDRQFKGQGGQPPDSDVPPPPGMQGQLVSPEPSVNSVQLEPHDRVIIVASGKRGVQSCPAILRCALCATELRLVS